MKIPGIGPTQGGQWESSDPKIQEYYNLWNAWYKNPTKKTGEKLLSFLEQNETYFTDIAKNMPRPKNFPPGTGFSHYYQDAIARLQSWLTHGCEKSGTTSVSEWVGDVYLWVSGK